MHKIAIVCLMVLAFTASAEFFEFDNNVLEYGDTISLPYPYYNNRDNTVVIKPIPPAPVYSNTYGNVIVPTSTEVAPSGLFSTAISCAFDVISAAVAFLLTNGPALLAGSFVALGICKLTPLCDSEVTIYEAQTELRSLATPERLSRAANFVKEAVKKYTEMQDS